MNITPLDGAIGAEVTDLDLAGPWTDSPRLEAIREAFRSRHLLLFRDPQLEAKDQIRLVEALGLEPDEWTDGEKFGFLSNRLAVAPNDGQHNAYLYHSDLMWKEQPISSISLYALVIPDGPRTHLVRQRGRRCRRAAGGAQGQARRPSGALPHRLHRGRQRYREETASDEAPRRPSGSSTTTR